MNAYGYCGADPINRTDPTGHIFKWTTKLFRRFFKSENLPASKIQLKDLDNDSFGIISKYLSSTDMNNLRLASKETKNMANQASTSNFNTYLNKKTYHLSNTPETRLDKVIEVGLGRKPGISSSEAGKTISLNMAQNLFPTHATPGYTYMPTSLITGNTLIFDGSSRAPIITRRHSYALAIESLKPPSFKDLIIEKEYVTLTIRRGSL